MATTMYAMSHTMYLQKEAVFRDLGFSLIPVFEGKNLLKTGTEILLATLINIVSRYREMLYWCLKTLKNERWPWVLFDFIVCILDEKINVLLGAAVESSIQFNITFFY